MDSSKQMQVKAAEQMRGPTAGRRLKVLVDGYNIDLVEGTGLKTYGLNFLRAIHELGHETSVLLERSIPRHADQLLAEMILFGSDPPMSRLRIMREYVQLYLKALFGFGKKDAVRVAHSQSVIVPPSMQFIREAMTSPQLYRLAMLRHVLRGKFTTVRLAKTVDIMHLTMPLPIRVPDTKTLLTIHDLIPLKLPYTTLDNKVEILRRFRSGAKQADLIIAVSEWTKRDIVELLGIDPQRIVVTYQTTDLEPLRPSESAELPRYLRRFGVAPKNYILFVGAIEPKKNLGRLLEAFLESDVTLPLLVVGRRAWLWEREIGRFLNQSDTRIARRVKFLEYVPRSDLRFLYAGAQFFAFPSLYEGFGLPLLEAMRFGLPILTSNTSAMPEVCGEAAIYVDPYDSGDIREKLERLAGEPELRTYLSGAALQQAEKFSDERYRSAIADVLQRFA